MTNPKLSWKRGFISLVKDVYKHSKQYKLQLLRVFLCEQKEQ